MTSRPKEDIPSDDYHSVKATSGTERPRFSESPFGEGTADVGDTDTAKVAGGPRAFSSDGPGDVPRSTAETNGNTRRSDARDGGGRDLVEPATSAKAAEVPANNRLKQKCKDPCADSPPSPTAPKPLLEDSWKIVMKEVVDVDDEQFRSWKEDIDTLLVFAGLFSAVVTAFTIESYQWLSEDPQDTAVALLREISRQMKNESMMPVELFEASSSNIRINTFWFLSLIIALVDALFGLLCKQWLREHRRPIHTHTPQEALALHWLRRESLALWHIPTLVGALPMLLELALFLFFAGLLELLWSRHLVPFSIAMAVVAFAALFYIGTTILPSFEIIRQAWQVTPELRNTRPGQSLLSPVNLIQSLPPMEFTCPYKSPQAWATFKAAQAISSTLHAISDGIVDFLMQKNILQPGWYHKNYFPAWHKKWVLDTTLNTLLDWPSVDLEVIQRSNAKLVPHFYELKAFRWLVKELQDTPSMIPHLQNTLETIPPHLVMPTVFDQWFFHPRRDWTAADIGTVLQPNLPSGGIEKHRTFYQTIWLRTHSSAQQSITFRRLLHYNHILINWRECGDYDTANFIDVSTKIWGELQRGFGSMVGLPFSFSTLDSILEDPSQEQFGLELFESCTEIFRHPQWCTRYYPLPHNLAQYIIATSTPHNRTYGSPAVNSSPFVRSQICLALVQQIHGNLLADKPIGSQEAYDWLEATDIVQYIHDLPRDHFPPLPGYFSVPLTRLEGLLGALPDEPSDSDFEFLFSYQKHWSNVEPNERASFIEILVKHINGLPALQDCGTDTSFITHPRGMEFIRFLDSRWDALHIELENQYASSCVEDKYTEPWMKALERARVANGLSPDEFDVMLKSVPGERTSDSPLDNTALQPIQGDDTSTGVRGGEGYDDGVVGRPDGSRDGEGVLSDKATEMEALAVSVEKSGGRDVGQTSQEGNDPVGGVGADNNV